VVKASTRRDGIVREIGSDCCRRHHSLDRRARGPYGLNGGKAGKPGAIRVAPQEESDCSSQDTSCTAGDVLRIETPAEEDGEENEERESDHMAAGREGAKAALYRDCMDGEGRQA